jgi:hypothetical protein
VKDPPSLILFQCAIGVELVLEDPFSGDDVGANMTRDKVSSVVGDQSIIFFLHGVAPGWVDEGSADRGGHRRERRRRGGRQGEFVGWQPEASLRPRGHRMRVDRSCH